jgi:hypothetical protein
MIRAIIVDVGNIFRYDVIWYLGYDTGNIQYFSYAYASDGQTYARRTKLYMILDLALCQAVCGVVHFFEPSAVRLKIFIQYIMT